MDIQQELQRMGPGDHLCLVYENATEQWDAVVPYMAQGLARNEACLYVIDDRSLDEVRQAFIARGVDVDAHLSSGQLIFATKREAYLCSGAFDPTAMISFLEQTARQALAAGRTGFRVTGEMTWALGHECGCDRLIEYEALLSNFFPGSHASAICQYSRKRFSADIIRDVLRTHPVAILGHQVCPNLYYESPAMVLGQGSTEQRVEWMIQQLQRFRSAERKLERAVQARDDFLSVASHELNTPLTSLKLHIQSLTRTLGRGDLSSFSPQKMMGVIDSTDRQLRRLSRLVSDLLDVSRIHAHKLTLHLENVELWELVADVVDRMSGEFARAGMRLDIAPGSQVKGLWDRGRLEQVVINLLSNALKYGAGRPVHVEVSSDGERARLSVKDQGGGIREEDRARIFERFERAISANEASGLGLGLYIAREIVQVHGGTISVESRLGEGSTFTVTLPLDAEG
ncbi:MEDS domain-containing protein [Archangium violaceum]|uniref:MEDS domain-containing protein n=1 Tax=Archangium violaceum TaxID=83451 RepID=UPI00193B3D71|nr:MEDS domain-containing protein [Archangium violaceum]QRK10022.1 MEDS domain-containing protein [Archangium violaceum]